LVRFGKWEAVEAGEAGGVVVGFGPAEVEDLDREAVAAAGEEALGAVGNEGFGVGPGVDVVLIDGVEVGRGAQVLESGDVLVYWDLFGGFDGLA
jgi:hypothetical protein